MTPFAAKTHPGLRRSRNEDHYSADVEHGLWVVADGVGGHTHGDVASRIACEQITSHVLNGDAVAASINSAHRAVLDEMQRMGPDNNMGTTVVVVKLEGLAYEIAWVGDSRAYVYDTGKISMLTSDHSAVADLIERGVITPDQASTHPQRHALSRSLGVSERNSSEPSVVRGSLKPGQQILMCTDGLTDELSDTSIAYLLSAHHDPAAQVEALVDKALISGGRDNITVLVIGEAAAKKKVRTRVSSDLDATQDINDPVLPEISRKPRLRSLLAVALIAGICVAGLVLWLT